MELAKRLIVGLGNPGTAYAKTRHNVGYRIVKALSKQHGLKFSHSDPIDGDIAEGEIKDRSAVLLLPTTYMNVSGEAVKSAMERFKIASNDLLVISDDVDLPFGKLRLREGGSAGGHKGLKNIEMHLSSLHYARLRVGVGDREEGDLADYVLGRFTPEEEIQFAEVVSKATTVIETWLSEGLKAALEKIS